MTQTQNRYEAAYPELFAGLPAEWREAVGAALTSDRLEHGDVSRDQVGLVIRSITETMTDEDYVAAVLDQVAVKHQL